MTQTAQPDQPRQRRSRPTRTAVVQRSEWLTPDMVRVVLGGDDLRQLGELPYTDHYVKLLFPPAGADYAWPFDPDEIRADRAPDQWPVTRTYTIRSFDHDVAEMTIDFVVHGDEGLAGPWAAAARPGTEIGFHGPGGAYAPDPAAPAHLLVGDEAAIPAIAAALEKVPAGVPTSVFAEVSGPEHQPPVPSGDHIEMHWIHRGDRTYGERLAEAVRDAGRPAEGAQIFVHGNADLVRDLRRFLFLDHRWDRNLVSISGYWRTGYNEDRWQATKRDFNAAMEADEQG